MDGFWCWCGFTLLESIPEACEGVQLDCGCHHGPASCTGCPTHRREVKEIRKVALRLAAQYTHQQFTVKQEV